MKRRDFLKSTGFVAGASVLGGMSVARGANVGGDDVIKIALVGCGGRGRGGFGRGRGGFGGGDRGGYGDRGPRRETRW